MNTQDHKGIFENLAEFDNHSSVVFLNDPASDLRGFIVIHRNHNNTPSFGATRILDYSSEEEALRDALRLSKTMSYKNALAGVKYGGAKGVIMKTKKSNKANLLRVYAEKLNYLGGKFITGADVGLDADDVREMKKSTKFVVGTTCQPEVFTAQGLLCGTQTVLENVFGSESLNGRSFAIQGLGKVGTEFLKLIYGKAGKIFASDIDQKQADSTKKIFPSITLVLPSEIHKQAVDVFAPCALSYSLNNSTIKDLNCRIVAGGANNQLENENIGELLHKLDIIYVPDYVINAGGLISVADEYENGGHDEDRVREKVSKIADTVRLILEEVKRTNQASNMVADRLAEARFRDI